MEIAVLGRGLGKLERRALASAGFQEVSAERAPLRIFAGPRPPVPPPRAPWIWLATSGLEPAAASAAVLAGAYDAIEVGPDLAAVLARRYAELATSITAGEPPPGFVARSPAARRVLADLDRAANTSMAVLLTGETGTGKDLAARHLHARSGRKGELVPINCAAVPNDLIEGELFGYVRGAFSGAVANYDGLFTAAEHGTVFLDEVDDTPK
ncbi:MAG TPA: sigma 54-interacting transcriptional regulator, partial [Kofleriaceae bacterium]